MCDDAAQYLLDLAVEEQKAADRARTFPGQQGRSMAEKHTRRWQGLAYAAGRLRERQRAQDAEVRP